MRGTILFFLMFSVFAIWKRAFYTEMFLGFLFCFFESSLIKPDPNRTDPSAEGQWAFNTAIKCVVYPGIASGFAQWGRPSCSRRVSQQWEVVRWAMETLTRGGGFPLSAVTVGGGMNGWGSTYEWGGGVAAVEVNYKWVLVAPPWRATPSATQPKYPNHHRLLKPRSSPVPKDPRIPQILPGRQLATTNRTANTGVPQRLGLCKPYIPLYKSPKYIK